MATATTLGRGGREAPGSSLSQPESRAWVRGRQLRTDGPRPGSAHRRACGRRQQCSFGASQVVHRLQEVDQHRVPGGCTPRRELVVPVDSGAAAEVLAELLQAADVVLLCSRAHPLSCQLAQPRKQLAYPGEEQGGSPTPAPTRALAGGQDGALGASVARFATELAGRLPALASPLLVGLPGAGGRGDRLPEAPGRYPAHGVALGWRRAASGVHRWARVGLPTAWRSPHDS